MEYRRKYRILIALSMITCVSVFICVSLYGKTALRVMKISYKSLIPKIATKYHYEVTTSDINTLHLLFISCNNHSSKVINCLKSVVTFTRRHLTFHIFGDENDLETLNFQLRHWPASVRNRISYRLYPAKYPDGTPNVEIWNNMFRKCNSLKHFFPELLDLDAAIYMDVDTVTFQPIEELFELFSQMNDSQAIGFMNEGDVEGTGYYDTVDYPVYSPKGLNAGVMMLNLTKLRKLKLNRLMEGFRIIYSNKIRFGEQCVINMLLHYFPEVVYIFPCKWNYRFNLCDRITESCEKSLSKGPGLIHGTRGTFVNDDVISFKKTYQQMQKFDLKDDVIQTFVEPLQKELLNITLSSCGKVVYKGLENMKELVASFNEI